MRPKVKVLYATCGEDVTVYVLREHDDPVKDGWGHGAFDCREEAEAWARRQDFEIVEEIDD